MVFYEGLGELLVLSDLTNRHVLPFAKKMSSVWMLCVPDRGKVDFNLTA